MATLIARNANEAIVALLDGSVGALLLVVVWSMDLGGKFCFRAFGTNLASVVVKNFSYLIFKKCCTFYINNAICKDTASIA